MSTLRLFLIPILCVFAFGASAHAQGTTRVSVDSNGQLSNAGSASSAVTPEGRFVVFVSEADNLVASDTNGLQDVFVHDRLKGFTTRVSVDSAGLEANGVSGHSSISDDGRYIAFESVASNLVVGDTNATDDVFVHDRSTGMTTRVSISSAGLEANQYSRSPSISADGRRIAFLSRASNLDVRASVGFSDVFVHDTVLGLTEAASVSPGSTPNGPSASPSISGNGKVVTFNSAASNLVLNDTNTSVDVFTRSLGRTARTERISVDSAGVEANAGSSAPSISFDGKLVAFHTMASNLVASDLNGLADVFVRDRLAQTTEIVSVDSLGVQADGHASMAKISADGLTVVFSSVATNLVAGDTNGVEDVFLHDRNSATTLRTSVSSAGVEGRRPSFGAAVSADGRYVSYTSRSRSAHEHIFFRDRFAPCLTKLGSCPGPITLTVYGGTIGDDIAIAYGQAGYYVKPSPPCQGIELGIEVPVFAVLTPTFNSGKASVNFMAPIGACGITFQAVDVASCKVSNPIVL